MYAMINPYRFLTRLKVGADEKVCTGQETIQKIQLA